MAQIGYEAMNSEYRAIAYQRKSVVQMKDHGHFKGRLL